MKSALSLDRLNEAHQILIDKFPAAPTDFLNTYRDFSYDQEIQMILDAMREE